MLFMYTAWIVVSRAIISIITGNFHNDLQYWTEFVRNAQERYNIERHYENCQLLSYKYRE